jgi:hypothetical protein
VAHTELDCSCRRGEKWKIAERRPAVLGGDVCMRRGGVGDAVTRGYCRLGGTMECAGCVYKLILPSRQHAARHAQKSHIHTSISISISDIQSLNMYLPTSLLTLSALASSSLSSPLLPRACTGPPINAATLALIKEFEGFVASPVPDPIGLPTVGYGHLCQTSGCAEVPYAFPLSTTTASALLGSDVKVYHLIYTTAKDYGRADPPQGPATNHNPAHRLDCRAECESVRRAGILDVQCRARECRIVDAAAALECGRGAGHGHRRGTAKVE